MSSLQRVGAVKASDVDFSRPTEQAKSLEAISKPHDGKIQRSEQSLILTATHGLQRALRAAQPVKLLEYFINSGAQLTKATPEGETLLELAVTCYHDDKTQLAALQLLQKKSIDIHCLKTGSTSLHFLCAQKDPPPLTIAFLAEDSKAAELSDSSGYSPVQLVAREARTPVAPLRMDQVQGADLHRPDPLGNRPMHYLICKLPSTEIQALLLELINKDNVNIPDSKGYTVLQRAMQLEITNEDLNALVIALIERGADLSMPDPSGKTPKQILQERGIIKAEVSQPLDIKAVELASKEQINKDMWYSVIYGDVLQLKKAIQAGADKSLLLDSKYSVYRVAKFLKNNTSSASRKTICTTLLDHGFSKEGERPKAMKRKIAAQQNSPLYLDIALQCKPADFKKLNAHYKEFEETLEQERRALTRDAKKSGKLETIALSKKAEIALKAQARLLPHIVERIPKDDQEIQIEYLRATILHRNEETFTRLLDQTSKNLLHHLLVDAVSHGSLSIMDQLTNRIIQRYVDWVSNGNKTPLALLIERPTQEYRDTVQRVKSNLRMISTPCSRADKLAMIKILVSRGANLNRIFSSSKRLDELISDEFPDDIDAVKALVPKTAS